MSNPPDDTGSFDERHFDDLEADLDASYDDPLPEDFDADADYASSENLSADEDFGSDQDWDDQALDGDADALDQQPQRKKSSLLTYAIIGVVVLGGGAFALSQMGGAPAPEDVVIVDPETAPAGNSLAGLRDETPLPTAPEETPPAATPSQGFMNEAPPALPSAPALTAVDAPAVPPAEALPAVPAPPANAVPPADPAVISGLKPVSDFPSVDLIKKSDVSAPAAPSVPVPEATSGVPVPAPELAPTANPAELTVMQGRLDAAQTKIETLEKDLAAAKAAAVTAPAPSASPATNVVSELEEKVAALEEKLAARERDLNQAKAKAAQVVVAPPTRDESPIVEDEPVREVSEPVKPARVAPKAAPAKTVAWELRGAQPGKAILAKAGAGDDLRTVSAGDSLPGLGRITSIEQTASGWIVQGTQGRVVQ